MFLSGEPSLLRPLLAHGIFAMQNLTPQHCHGSGLSGCANQFR